MREVKVETFRQEVVTASEENSFPVLEIVQKVERFHSRAGVPRRKKEAGYWEPRQSDQVQARVLVLERDGVLRSIDNWIQTPSLTFIR